MKEFKDRVAVVTGAGGGMGRSMVLALASEGVNLVISDIEGNAAEAVRDEAIALGVDAIACATDVSKLDQVKALADTAYDEFGKVDILINNAGVTMRPFRATWDTSYEDFKWLIDVNIWGVVHGIHVFVPRMRKQAGEKHIVNTSSMGTLMVVPGHSTYVMTKEAVNGLSNVIREELKEDGFGVTILYPGYVPTRITTSERLRPQSERSEARNVTPYDTYIKTKGTNAKAANISGGTVVVENGGVTAEPLDPNAVGAMVVEAIRRNMPHLTTHPAPEVAIRKHADGLMSGYLGQRGEASWLS